ncbi:MAG: hypothetical protein K8953_01080 [Proteobacteria bacterium]|nr:hypothetical protein [Pseudomonadota bacterium]
MKTIYSLMIAVMAGVILTACVGAVNLAEGAVDSSEIALINRCIMDDNANAPSCASIVADNPCITDPFDVACDITFADYYKTAQANRISFCRENINDNLCMSAIENVCDNNPLDADFCSASVKTGDIPTCTLNPFQDKCYPAITQIKERQKALDALAPRRKELIDPVVAECAVNSVAENCRNAFVWCSDFENTNSLECANAVGADEGLFACLTDPYKKECEGQPALQEQISGQVLKRDDNGDVELDDNGEEITELKIVSLLENTILARISYCRDENDAGVPNIVSNPVLCESTVKNVCDDPDNPSGVFDVFCTTSSHAQKQLEIATSCRNDELTTVAEGCSSIVELCNENPFSSVRCNIPAFASARETRVDLCVGASTVDKINECRVEGANNPCFGNPFIDGVDGVDCTSEYNMGSAENVKTAQQNRTVLCVNTFIAKTYPDICGGASPTTISLASGNLGGAQSNGVGFFTVNDRFYAALFSSTNLGAPLDDNTQNGMWNGRFRTIIGTEVMAEVDMMLDVTYTGGTNTITSFVASGDNHFLLDGTFTAEGVIGGTVNYGVFTGGDKTTPANGRATNGMLTGLIGQDGAVGAFHSTATGTNGYAGGFVARPPAE